MKRYFYISALIAAGLTAPAEAIAQEEDNVEEPSVVLPVKRPLVEEYTGLWCSFCPRGFVALEEMAEQYGEDFVTISYHDNDAMAAQNLKDRFPSRVNAYPGASIDRVSVFDPSLLKNAYPRYLAMETNASVEVTLFWADEAHSSLQATTEVTFIEDIENADYKIAHILVADGLSNPSWRQSNAYTNSMDASLTGEWWDLFTKGGNYVEGLTFNFVAVYSDGTKGIPGSVPTSITAGEPIVYSSLVEPAKIVNLLNDEYVANYGSLDKLRMVSVLIDGATGQVVNSHVSNYLGSEPDDVEIPEPSRVNSINAPELSETYYIDFSGCRVANPEKGVYIKVENFSDGSRRASKIIF